MISFFESSQGLGTNPNRIVAREFVVLALLLHRDSLLTEFGAGGK
jgi:hypothetical protein